MDIRRIHFFDQEPSCYILDGDEAPQRVGLVDYGDHWAVDTMGARLSCKRAVVLTYGTTEEMGILSDERVWEDGSVSYTFQAILISVR